MAQEAVLIIKKAEEDARSIIENAEKDAAGIIENAQIIAKERSDKLKSSLKDEYEAAIKEARNSKNSKIEENLSKNRKDADDLEKKHLNNKEKAITEVLKKVLEG